MPMCTFGSLNMANINEILKFVVIYPFGDKLWDIIAKNYMILALSLLSEHSICF